MLQISSSHKPGMIRPFLIPTRRRGNEPLTPARRPWAVDEQKKLDDLTKSGKTAAEIAIALERTPTSIYSRLQRLDIKRKKAARRVVEIGRKAKLK
jgi:hypothetical protein